MVSGWLRLFEVNATDSAFSSSPEETGNLGIVVFPLILAVYPRPNILLVTTLAAEHGPLSVLHRDAATQNDLTTCIAARVR
jgi:hypothetical protein